MKTTTRMVLGTMLAVSVGTMAELAAEPATGKAATLYKQGIEALENGEASLATECFREVLRIQPSHANARYQLLSIEQRKPQLAAKVRQKKLEQIKIPKVDFDETGFEDAIDTLDALIEKETEGKFAPNFVVQDPHGMLSERRVTIKLGAVPANVVLDYILKSANAKVRFDEHAIVIQPIGKPPKEETVKDEEQGGKAKSLRR